uniref:Transcriptional regulator, IclR family n=1 Tax=uncultured organism TaxID=155900 RepID=M1P195_9ZZZZ|nr:transcriptional regulator, IclR family [uncultured organism]
MSKTQPVKSVSRALSILNLLTSNSYTLSLAEISERVDLPKPTTHRMLQSLRNEGFVKQSPEDGSYKVGVKVFEMAHQYAENLDVRKEAQAELRKLNRQFDEIIHLAVLSGSEVVYIDKYDSKRALRIYSSVGKRVPAHCTALGKAILAYLTEYEINRILSEESLTKHTDSTITDRDELDEELESIRDQGFATDQGEHEEEISCIASPIFNHEHDIEAAVSVTIPSMRFNQDKVKEIAPVLKESAGVISRNIGYTENFSQSGGGKE